MRYKNNIHSSIANATAFTKKLEKVIITLTTGRTGYNNKDALLIEFGTDDSYSDYATTMSTVSGQAVYEIYPDTQDYTYVSISHNMPSYTVYVASIEYVFVNKVTVEESMNVYANKGKLANKIITWTGTDFTFRNEQYNSTSAIRTTDSDHFRCYAKSKTVISGNNGAQITNVVITTTGSSYASALKNSVNNSLYNVTVSGSVVTITPIAGPVDSIEIIASAQWRLKKLVVTCEK